MNWFFLFTIAVTAALNRAAGSDLFGLKPALHLPFKPLVWVAPLIGLLSAAWVPLQQAALSPYVMLPLSWLPEPLGEPVAQWLLAVSPHRLVVAWAVAFFVWRLDAVGRWIDWDMLPDDYNRVGIKPSLYERIIIKLSFGSDRLAMFIRHLMVVPGLWLVHMAGGPEWLWFGSPLVAAAFTLAQAAAFGLRYPKDFHWLGEMLIGVVWAMLLVASVGGAF